MTAGWIVETLNEIVDTEVNSLPEDMRARLARIAQLIEAQGLELVREPHVRHLAGPIWEMRLKGRSGIARALYVTAPKRRAVIVRAICKEDGEDTATRTRACPRARQVGR